MIKHMNLCASPDYMRKISYAYTVSLQYKNIGHFQLYKWIDLTLPEVEFKRKVIENLDKLNEKKKNI